ncbi:U3 small nucleolar RNA-associated protein 22 [Neolecta irregularis DAH-3]|uniref:U3 small nucleolar RNA-associated protein 22 n=1 Tax=Neolecta irregularis (strain DAH-3) TaxID=1198029 RepID=A0A1U7LJ50_NEOID|nr:U3 small nucleolar RNA-associated protein 22 [Neolecta irregularis DAH-3]|eukprot:OLL22674.1 U3 small nucleolar RNA-associated protein 22 [Neolecta irregularis DAH-3]
MVGILIKRKRTEEDSVAKCSETGRGAVATASQDPISAPQSTGSFTAPNTYDEAYSHNMLKLETDEILDEVKINFERLGEVDELLRKVKSLIEEIPPSSEMKILDYAQRLHEKGKIKVPFCEPKPSKEALNMFAYEKPIRVSVIGSFLLQTMAKHPAGLVIDLAVCMPKTAFQEKDYQDYRYFHKRACYVSVIASEIQKKAKSLDITASFDAWHGDLQKPVLLIRPKTKTKKVNFSIRIIPVLSEDAFIIKKLNSTRCNIRHLQLENPSKESTPRYNASILADMQTQKSLEFLYAQQKLCVGFKNACVLGRIWLEQRKFSGNYSEGGFGIFEWSMLLSFLLQGGGPRGGKLLAGGYTYVQLFKGVLQYIATHDLIEQPIKFDTGKLAVAVAVTGCPVLEDASSGLNYLYKMTRSSYLQLKFEAEKAHLALHNSSNNSFEALFLREIPHDHLRYDMFFRLSISPDIAVSTTDIIEPTLSRIAKIEDVIRKTLLDRVSLISIRSATIPTWRLNEVTPSYNNRALDVGFILNPERCDRIVERGPSADNREAAEEFRTFWGDKADLRRFKDGSIKESVVAQSEPSKFYPVIIEEFLDWTLQRHFGEQVAKCSRSMGMVVASSLDFATEYLPAVKSLASQVESFSPIVAAYDDIGKAIKGLEDLPLRVSSIMGSSPALRYSSTQIPLPHPQTNAANLPESCQYLQPIDFILQLESSGKWPDDLEAIKRVKVAFLLDISRRLQSQKSIPSQIHIQTSRHGREFPVLEIYHSTGYVFRAQLHHDRDATLYQNKINQLTALKDPSFSRYKDLLSDYTQTFVAAPRHTLQIQALCQQHPYLSPTIRLVKRWMHSHMLSPHIDDESIELLVASVFTSPFPFHIPSSAVTGFLRALQLLSSWDWRLDPTIVTTIDPIDANERDEISQNFKNIRGQDPAVSHFAWFIGTKHDLASISHTKERPSRVIATRVTYLAKMSLQALLQDSTDLAQSTFLTPLKHFDFIIHLNSDLNPRSYQRLSWKTSIDGIIKPVKVYKNVTEESLVLPKVDFDVVKELVKEIHDIYGETLVLLFDEFGGNVIAGLWTPKIKSQKTWKVNQGCSTIPVSTFGTEKADSIICNKAAILAELEELGGSLINKIEVITELS